MAIVIFISIFNAIIFLSSIAWIIFWLCWRKKYFVKQIHSTKFAIAFVCILLVLPLMMTFFEFWSFFEGSDKMFVLLAALTLAFYIPMYIVGLNHGCYCVYLIDSFVVEHKFFKEKRIDLSEIGSIIDYETFGKFAYVCFYSSERDIEIRIEIDYVQGDLRRFIAECQRIHSTYNEYMYMLED